MLIELQSCSRYNIQNCRDPKEITIGPSIKEYVLHSFILFNKHLMSTYYSQALL